DRGNAHEQGITCSPDNPQKDIATKLVKTKNMLTVWRNKPLRKILIDDQGVIDPFIRHRVDDQRAATDQPKQQEEDQTDHRHLVFLKSSPCVCKKRSAFYRRITLQRFFFHVSFLPYCDTAL